MFSQQLTLRTIHVILLILQFALVLLTNLNYSISINKFSMIICYKNKPDLPLEHEHFSAVYIQDLVFSHDDVVALNVPVLTVVVSCLIPTIIINILMNDIMREIVTYVSKQLVFEIVERTKLFSLKFAHFQFDIILLDSQQTLFLGCFCHLQVFLLRSVKKESVFKN